MALTVSLTLVQNRTLAVPIVQLLADNGIRSFVQSDDCGGVDPALAFANGTRIMVDPGDLATARHLLLAYENAPFADDFPDEPPDAA